MSGLEQLALGFSVALSWETLLFCFIGVAFGTFVGVLPGIGALAAISILLPLTFHVPPTSAIIMLAGIYYGSTYGGSTASILLNLPGTPSAAVTCLDGYPMAKKGRAGAALFMTTIASFIGGSIGIIVLMLLSPPLAAMAMDFGAAEYFSMMLLGLVAASTLSSGSPAKGLAMVFLGLVVGIVGIDAETGESRFVFGQTNLFDGVSLVALAMGLLGISEIISQVGLKGSTPIKASEITWRSLLPTRKEWRDSVTPMLRGSALGVGFGALPGTGPSVASFISYAIEKRVAKDPSRFGNGAIEGVTAPEAANNAAAQSAFIPTLTLGIPGDAIMALMIGALMIHGIQPGPSILIKHPDLFWGLVASFWIGNLMLLVLNIPLIGIWVRMIMIPYHVLYPVVLVFACIGVYSVSNTVFDIYVLLGAGLVGYVMMVLGFPAAPLLLGYILGPLVEGNFRRSMLISGGDPSIFIDRPISAGFLAVTAVLIVLMLYSTIKRKRLLKSDPA